MTSVKHSARKVLNILVAIVLVVGLIPGLSIATNSSKAYAADDTVNIYLDTGDSASDRYIHYGGYSTCDAYATINGETYRAYCAQPSLSTPTSKTYSDVSALEHNETYAALAAAMWYAYDAPGFQEGYEAGLWPDTYPDSNGNPIALDPNDPNCADTFRGLSHIVISDLYDALLGGGGGEAALSGCYEYFKDWARYNLTGYVGPELVNSDAACPRIGYEWFGVATNEDHVAVWPSGFEVYDIPTGSTQHMLTFTYVPTGEAQLVKASSNTSVTDNNSCYSLDGATFGVYSDYECTNQVETLTCNSEGTSNTVTLSPATYWVKEISAPAGYKIDSEVHECIVNSGETTPVYVYDEPLNDPLFIQIAKYDPETGEPYDTTPQGDATLAGAEYTVEFYGDYFYDATDASSHDKLRTWVFETDGEGNITCTRVDRYAVEDKCDDFYMANGAVTYPLGTYVIYESASPSGYEMSTDKYIVRLVQDGDGTKTEGDAGEKWDVGTYIGDDEPVTRGYPEITKVDAETLMIYPLGGASLYKSVFEIVNESEHDVVVDGQTYAPGEVVETIETSEGDLVATVTTNGLPYGTYRIYETETGEGYLLNDTEYMFNITEDGVIVEVGQEGTHPNQVIRGDIEFDKADELNQTRMANVAFMLTSNTTEESHVLVTDENGYTSTASNYNLHTFNTNANDEAVTIDEDGNYIVDDELLDSTAGIWFGQYIDENGEVQITEAKDDLGALPYDTYTLTELPCAANEGYELVDPITVTVTRDGFLIDMGTIDDPDVSIGTQAIDGDDGDKVIDPAASEITIVDTVGYNNLIMGREYTVTGTLMDKATGEALLDADGNEIVATTTFVAESEAGTIDVEFTFDSSDMNLVAGDQIVVFETLYQGDRELAVHADIDDEGQTVTLEVTPPSIHTLALDAADGDHYIEPKADQTVVDTVTYENLTVGKEYTLVGVLMNQNTKDVVTDADGNSIYATTTFTPEAADGEVEVTFTFDATDMADFNLVVFEYLFAPNDEGYELVCDHTDIDDVDQLITVSGKPEIHTMAVDAADGDKYIEPEADQSIRDTVSYTNLVVGTEYTLTGVLMNQTTGEALLDADGNEIVATTTFTPKTADGEVDVTFTFDASDMSDFNIVVFEYLTKENEGEEILVAEHADLTDVDQTIYINKVQETTPVVTTTSTETPTGSSLDKTGQDIALATLLALLAMAAVGIGVYAHRQRKLSAEGFDDNNNLAA